jgi:hypothetical protein
VTLTARIPSRFKPESVSRLDESPKLLRTTDERDVHWPGFTKERVPTGVHDGPPKADEMVLGPAVVELAHTTVAVAPEQQLRAFDDGTLVLKIA